jgi:uncharacterized LabA/DUF88 family protein
MAFDTAIFYDIENLIKGYSFSQQTISSISLGAILRSVQDTGRTGQIALQRAYANWSDARLAILRGEINELGIDPVQVFGFARDPKKNAADIQLAIDAIDLAHIRPAVHTYVIVSGDGGFAALAKKLHEYGKTVIGCAYKSATNSTLLAVCDAFVFIQEPEEEERPAERIPPCLPSGHPLVSDPRNVRMAARIKQCTSDDPAVMLARTREVLRWYAEDSECRNDLIREGMHLSVIQEGVRYAVPGFQPMRFGFMKFIEFLQHACAETPLCVARGSDTHAVLVPRTYARYYPEVLPDLEPVDWHTEEGYRAILAQGMPVLRLPDRQQLHAVFAWLTANPPFKCDVGSLIEAIVSSNGDAIPYEAAKTGVLSLVAAGAFEQSPIGVPLSEQVLTLRPELREPSALWALVSAAAKRKIESVLGHADEAILTRTVGLG